MLLFRVLCAGGFVVIRSYMIGEKPYVKCRCKTDTESGGGGGFLSSLSLSLSFFPSPYRSVSFSPSPSLSGYALNLAYYIYMSTYLIRPIIFQSVIRKV